VRELKRRDLHDIQTILHLLAHWDHLQLSTTKYAAHGLPLLYIAVTKGWPAALYFDQQGTDEFLDLPSEFWAGFQPPARPKVSQPRTSGTRGKSSTGQWRGEQWVVGK
jgi:hypothetical protein